MRIWMVGLPLDALADHAHGGLRSPNLPPDDVVLEPFLKSRVAECLDLSYEGILVPACEDIGSPVAGGEDHGGFVG